MKTQVTGFILMGLAAVLAIVNVGFTAVMPASAAFLAGMYFGIIINTKKEE